jgi:hypothetical protein
VAWPFIGERIRAAAPERTLNSEFKNELPERKASVCLILFALFFLERPEAAYQSSQSQKKTGKLAIEPRVIDSLAYPKGYRHTSY